MNGKDIRKVMDNAFFIFDEFKAILKEGNKWDEPLVTDYEIDAVCDQYKSVFLLWDGAFSLARKIDPTEDDIKMYSEFVAAAFESHQEVGCNVTHKVHLMAAHVRWQMMTLEGGLGDKMEDWVELAHQAGARRRRRFCTTVNQGCGRRRQKRWPGGTQIQKSLLTWRI